MRTPESLRIAHTGQWVGAAGWSSLLKALEVLPVPSHEVAVWRELLRVMVHDGDLLERPSLTREQEITLDLVEAVRGDVLEHFVSQIAGRAKALRRGVRDLADGHVRSSVREPWVGLALLLNGETWVHFAIRGLVSPAPEALVWFFPAPNRRAARGARRAVATLAAQQRRFREFSNGWRWRSSQPHLRNAEPDRYAAWCNEQIDAIVMAGAFDEDPLMKEMAQR